MIVRSGQPVTLRDIFDQFGLVSIQRHVRRYCRPYLKRRKQPFATLGVRNSPGATKFFCTIEPSSFVPFAPIAHERFDELGLGWYAQISHCRQCGRQDMMVLSLAYLLQPGISVYCQPATWI